MSKTAKIVLIIIILIAVLAVIWAYVPKHTPAGGTNQPEQTYVASTTDTSDTAINDDMSDLNAQLGDLNSDEASLDATSSVGQ